MGTVSYSVVLVLLRLFLLFLLLLAVAIEHNGQNNESDTWANDDVEPAGGLEFVQSGLRLFVAFLVKETPECEAIHCASISEYACLKVSAPADNIAWLALAVRILQDRKIDWYNPA